MMTRSDVEKVLQRALGMPVGAWLTIRMSKDDASQFCRHAGSIRQILRKKARASGDPRWDQTAYDRLIMRRGPAGLRIQRLSPHSAAVAQATIDATRAILNGARIAGDKSAEIVLDSLEGWMNSKPDLISALTLAPSAIDPWAEMSIEEE